MLRRVAACLLLCLASGASAQVIYAPAPTYVYPTHPFNPCLDPHRVSILSSLQEPGATVIVNNGLDRVDEPMVRSNGPIVVTPDFRADYYYGVEAYKQFPLYFRKRDLLPPSDMKLIIKMPETQPAQEKAPAAAPAIKPVQGKGTIQIIPSRVKFAAAK